LHFVSGHSGVRSAIESAMPELKTALADNGISLGQSSVGSDSSQWQQAQQQSQSGSQQGNAASWAAFNSGSNTSASDALPVPASIASRVSGNNSVDIFA
ncbi:flagellar hook-length control protein FliK, partial [Rahnella perminowiae]